MIYTKAKNWSTCKKIAFGYWGRECLFCKLYPGFHGSDIIDPAHIFARGSHKHLSLVPLNVIPLDRYCHSLIDQNIHPITKEFMPKQTKHNLFLLMIGMNNFNKLIELDYTLKKSVRIF